MMDDSKKPYNKNVNSSTSTRPATAGRPTTAHSRPQTGGSTREVARERSSTTFVPKRGLSEMASLLDAMESKLKDGIVTNDSDSDEEVIVPNAASAANRRSFIEKELAALINELNLANDPTHKYTKASLGDEQVSYTLLHRALRELVKEKQMCASEVEDMRSKVLDKESSLLADLHHVSALKDALSEKLKTTEMALAAAQSRIGAIRHKKQVLKESLKEESESGSALLKQKLNAENMLDAANAHIASLTQKANVYETKLSEVTEKLLGVTKLQVKLENKSSIEAAAFESKIANLSKVNAERKESLERAAAENADMSRQNQVLRTQLAAAQTQLNHLTQRLADRHQSDLKAMQASKRHAREKQKEAERDKIDPPTGQVTLVFTDVQGSTAQWEANPEIMTIALDIHFKIMREHMNRAGGYECKTEGDAFMIAFQSPLQAVSWCMMVQEALLVADWPPALLLNEHSQEERSPDGRLLFRGLRVRIGAHTGTPQCHPDPVSKRMDYFGPMVNRAARVSGLAHGGQVVVSGRTWREIERDVSGVDILHMGEHSLKGIKGKEQIVQLLPVTLAGRKFPPLASVEAQKSHFEEKAPNAAPNSSVIPASISAASAPVVEDEDVGDAPPSPSPQYAPVLAKIRETLSSQTPDGSAQGELILAVNEAEKQLKHAWDEISELKSVRRELMDRLADNEDRMAALDDMEAEASEWRGMVDALTLERKGLEDLVRAEHAEKEFFLRKLMESNKEVQGLNTVSSYARDMKKETDFHVSDILAMSEKEKVEALLRANSKIKSLHGKVQYLKEEKKDERSLSVPTPKYEQAQPQLQTQQSQHSQLHQQQPQHQQQHQQHQQPLLQQQQQQPEGFEFSSSPIFKAVHQVIGGQNINQHASPREPGAQPPLSPSGLHPLTPSGSGPLSPKFPAPSSPLASNHSPRLTFQPIAHVQSQSFAFQSIAHAPSQSFSIANHQSHGSSVRLVNSPDHFHKEQEKVQALAEKNKVLEQQIAKLNSEHATKLQSSQNHIASLLQRLADAEKASVLANVQVMKPSESIMKQDADIAKREREIEILKAKLKDTEEELHTTTKAKEELSTQWKEIVEPVLVQKPAPGPSNNSKNNQRKPAVDVPTLMKKLRIQRERIEALEAERKEFESRLAEGESKLVSASSSSSTSSRGPDSPKTPKKRETPRKDGKEEVRRPRSATPPLPAVGGDKREEVKEDSTVEEEKMERTESGKQREAAKKEMKKEGKNDSNKDLAKRDGRQNNSNKELAKKEVKSDSNKDLTKKNESNKDLTKKDSNKELSRRNQSDELQIITLKNQVTNLESENDIIVQENFRLNELVDQLETELRTLQEKKASTLAPAPIRGRRGSVSPDVDGAEFHGNRRRSISLTVTPTGEGFPAPHGRRGSIVNALAPPEPEGGNTHGGRRNSISPDPGGRRNSITPVPVNGPKHRESSKNLGLLIADAQPDESGRPRSTSDPPNPLKGPVKSTTPPLPENNLDLLQTSTFSSLNPSSPRTYSNFVPPTVNVNISDGEALSSSGLQSAASYGRGLTPSGSKPGGWSNMIADMDEELEHLTTSTGMAMPVSPKPLSASGAKPSFTLDTFFTKKGQQFLTPIAQKSTTKANTQANVNLGLSGKSFS